MGKTIRRTPDGKLERRTPDELLRDAVAGDMDLPGKGKALDLRAYFQPDAEYRLAGKIMRDNNALPPQLQERKDAEDHLAKAETHLRRARKKIAPLQAEIRGLAQPLMRTFSNSEAMREALGLNALPADFHPDEEMPAASDADLHALIEHYGRLCKRHNALVNTLTTRYMDALRRASENIEASNKRQLHNRSLLPALPPVDIETRQKDIQKRFARLPEVSPDWKPRLKTWQRARRRSVWQRVFRSMSLNAPGGF